MNLRDCFPPNDKDAEKRFLERESTDPFTDIPSGLLNSSDLVDYIKQTGMVFPFDHEKDVKSASISCKIGDRYHYWDEEEKLRTIPLEKEEFFTLPANSIAFVETAETFRLPEYIAVRFNLHITLVHRGLLLGTGPLVDPGFAGRLLVPIHNLTNNEYSFKQGGDFIWAEFTKLTPHFKWDGGATEKRSDQPKLAPFPVEKRYRDAIDYFKKAQHDGANAHSSIRSSIPSAVKDATDKANEAITYIKWARRIAYVAGIAGAFGIYFGIYSIIQANLDLVGSVKDDVTNLREQIFELEKIIQKRQAKDSQTNTDTRETTNLGTAANTTKKQNANNTQVDQTQNLDSRKPAANTSNK